MSTSELRWKLVSVLYVTLATAQTLDPAGILVTRLDLDRYKATIKGLTQFGDRRQGTERNRAPLDWIEARMKSYGCADIERIHYDYQPNAPWSGRSHCGPRRIAPARKPHTGRRQ